MYASLGRGSKLKLTAVSSAVALALVAAGAQAQISQSLERKNMNRVGHTDVQGRPAYQPNVIQYPDGRWMLFVGMHSGSPRQAGGCGANALPNPLKPGSPCENNGSLIIDVTNPAAPVEKYLIPAPAGGQAQMTRMCLGRDLTGDPTNTKVYLQRNVQGGASAGYEVWDVTDVNNPVMTSAIRNIRSTHKQWWECNTGITYAPGSKAANFTPNPPTTLFRQSQAMMILDWKNPLATPTVLRTFALPGGQPSGTGAVPNSLHGAISAHEHPQGANRLARGATADDIISNRIYVSWGVGDDGVHSTLDRKKLLPPSHGGTWTGSADNPTEADLIGPTSPTVSYVLMSPDQGGHTSFPVFGMKPPSYQRFNEFQTRDIVILSSEATADGVDGRCNEAPHWTFLVDVTVENSFTSPPGTRVEHDGYHGPFNLSTLAVNPAFGERYPRGNYCGRGARFGVHSSEENFRNPYYGKLTSIAYFNGGARVYDIREPHKPMEIAFYVPEANANTDPDGYMTNNIEIDNRGYIYIVDRNGAGMDILELFGCAKTIGDTGNGSCPRID